MWALQPGSHLQTLNTDSAGKMALFVYVKMLRSNCRCNVSALADHGRLCTPVHKRVHRQRPHFGMWVKLP